MTGKLCSCSVEFMGTFIESFKSRVAKHVIYPQLVVNEVDLRLWQTGYKHSR